MKGYLPFLAPEQGKRHNRAGVFSMGQGDLRHLSLFTAIVTGCFGLSLFSKNTPEIKPKDPASPILSFETDKLSGSLQSLGGSKVTLSKRHYINGSQSLAWKWKGPSSIQFNRPIPYVDKKAATQALKRSALSVFSFWVYSEMALSGAKLRVSFGRKGGEDCGFDFGLDFTGWRTCSVAFDRDMAGKPTEGMNSLRITAPSAVKEGRVFLDRIILSSVDDIRYQWPDRQVPFVKGKDCAPPDMASLPVPSSGENSPEDGATVDLLEQRMEASLLLPEVVSQAKVTALLKQFEALQIAFAEGVVRGRHVIILGGDRQGSVYPRVLTEQDAFLMKSYCDLRDYTDLMQRMAQAYRSLPSGNELARQLEEAFILMTRHLLDQGWQSGSALYTTHHFGYASRGWYIGVFLMRDVLQKAGLLDAIVQAQAWYMREKVNFAKMQFKLSDGTDLDYLNTLAKSHLMTALSLPDGSAKTLLIKRFSVYLSQMLAADTPGTLGGIKVDGTAFHHGGNYPGYSFPAFRSSAELCRLFAGTSMAISVEGRKNLKKALGAAALYCNPETGIGLCGRHPFAESSISELRDAFLNLALAGDLESGTGADLDLAAEYLRLAGKGEGDSTEIFGVCVAPAVLPKGHWSFNHGCFGIHRWKQKMVTIKGFNAYVWSSEIYAADNRYGRYQSNGSVQIMGSEGRDASGQVEPGWDWNRNPGATGIHLPLEQLESPNKNTLMYRSELRFGGSSHLSNRYGIFAVVLQEPDMEHFDPTFTARKSVFCFDDRLICLGSGISNKTGDFATETTLFQHQWLKDHSQIWFQKSHPVTEFPLEKSFTEGQPVWLLDGHGNGYYVAKGAVSLALSSQSSKKNNTKAPSKGDFVAAWINHGKAPDKTSYEYTILLDGTPKKMEAFAKEMQSPANAPYEVLRQDREAHIVKDRKSGVTGFALFEPYSSGTGDLLLKTDKPCLVMMRLDTTTKELSISACDTDLKIPGDLGYTTPKAGLAKPMELVLKGAWKLNKPDARIRTEFRNGETAVSIMQQNGIPVETKLHPGAKQP